MRKRLLTLVLVLLSVVSLSAQKSRYVPPRQYVLTLTSSAAFTPTASTTYYFGKYITTVAGSVQVPAPMTGRIVSARTGIYVAGTVASAGTSTAYLRLNNTTDYAIHDTLGMTDAGRANLYTNTSLNIAVSAGDMISVKYTTPAWTTAPTNIVWHTQLVIETP